MEKEPVVEVDEDSVGTSRESSSGNVAFTLSHLPPPDVQMSIYGLVVREDESD